MIKQKNIILTKEVVTKKINRLALEIAEQLIGDGNELIIIGIKKNGVTIAQKIAMALQQNIEATIKVISASLNKKNPTNVELSEAIDFNNKIILICDDVCNSGKTLLYVLKPLLSFHPKRIQTLVLVERMHKQFPIKPDYVGISIATTLEENIEVEVINNEIEGATIA